MSTTYERIRERLATNFMYLSALLVVSCLGAPHVPVPISLLSWPYAACVRVHALASDLIGCASRALRAVSSGGQGAGHGAGHGAGQGAGHGAGHGAGAQPQPLVEEEEEADERSDASPASIRLLEHRLSSEKEIAMLDPEAERPEEGVLRNETLLRTQLIRHLDVNRGDVMAMDEKWKSRQSRQIGALEQRVQAIQAAGERHEKLLQHVCKCVEDNAASRGGGEAEARTSPPQARDTVLPPDPPSPTKPKDSQQGTPPPTNRLFLHLPSLQSKSAQPL